MQSREHACELVAALLLVPLSVVGVCLDSPHAQTCTRAGYAHDLMHVSVSNDCGCRWQFWAHFVGGLGLRLLGYVVWFTVRLAATCLVMRQLVRRENAPSDLDLHSAMCCIRWWRSMFASLPSPRARRVQLNCV